MASYTKEKLEYLNETKGLIRTAIEAKGQSVSDLDTFRSYADKISSIESGSEPVLQDKEITENGSYSADEGFDGLGTVTVNIPDPTKTVILEEQEFNGFSLNETYGYAKIMSPPPFVLVKGETYFVVWDGETYETTAQAAPAFGSGALCLGNGVPVGASGNGEPFVIGYMASAVALSAFTDNRESHTVGIYQKVTQEIKLQDKTVTENGEYSADAGFDGLGKVIVDIAQNAASGKPLCKVFDFVSEDVWGQRVSVDFGFKPDIIVLWNGSTIRNLGTQQVPLYASGVSQAFRDNVMSIPNRITYISTSDYYKEDIYGDSIDGSEDKNSPISDADETGFLLGRIGLTAGYIYCGFAIGGLF